MQNLVIVSFALIPLAIGVSVLRYRLFDIDVVINRAVLFGALAVFITLVYVAIVVGVGTLVGSRASPVLSAAAAAIVALAFQPLRRRAQRLADRLVYGKRATPYEVLSEFSERVGQTYANEELLPRMARALGEGTGAARADVWVRVGEELRPEATWPQDVEPLPARPASSVEEGVVTGASMSEPVRHRGELLGALTDREASGREPVGDGGEAGPRPRRAGGARDAQRRAHRGADGHDRTAPRRHVSASSRRRTRSAASSSATCTTARSSRSWR